MDTGVDDIVNYVFRRIGNDNIVDLVALIKQVTHKRRLVEFYKKKYHTPWARGQFTGWLAYDKNSGRVVSVAAALPLYAVLQDGSQEPLTQMTETFTLPEHRGRGLMTWMAKKIIEEHQQNGTRLFFGLFNQNNVHGFVKKLGFTQSGNMEYFRLSIITFPFEAICRRCRIPGLYRWWAKKVLKPYIKTGNPELHNSAIQEGFGGVLHDHLFFSYKTFTFNRVCRFDGIDAWLKFESGLLVGDVILPAHLTDAQFDKWLATLKKLARHTGLHQIIFQTHPLSRLGKNLAARMKPSTSWYICYLDSTPDRPSSMEKMRFCYGDFDTF